MAGVRLWLSEHFNDHNGHIAGETRADGSFELMEIPEARYLGALSDDLAPAHMRLLSDLQVEGAASQDVELELVLGGPGASLQLTVVDEHGEPISAVWVRAKSWVEALDLGGGRSAQNVPPHDGWTDVRGELVFRGLPPGSPKLRVLAPGMAPWHGTAAVNAGRLTQLRVQLGPECVVFGVMRDAKGDPAVGARVRLSGTYDPFEPMTDVEASGHYELRGLAPGHVSLMASDPEFGSVKTTLEATNEQPIRWDAVLDGGRRVAGRVVDSAGEPLVGWRIYALLGIHDPWRAFAKTDEQGRFQLLDCKSGTLIVELYRDRRKEHMPTLTRRVGEQDHDELLLRVTTGDLCDGSLRARFVSENDEPQAQVSLALWRPGSNSAPRFKSDAQGRLEISGLRPEPTA